MSCRSTCILATAALAACLLVPSWAFAQTTIETIDPVWERSNERHAYQWWQTALDGAPNVIYYGAEGGAWSWTTPTTSTWSHYDASRSVSWFYTLEGNITANSWFRTTLPVRPGKRLVGFSLTSADKPGQGIGINDGIYVFLDGQFTGTFASVTAHLSSNVTPNIGVVRDFLFPTEWRCNDLRVQVNDTGPASHEIAVAFEEDFGWGGLTRLRIVAEYEDIDDSCPGSSPIQVNLSGHTLFLLGGYNGGHDVEGKVAAGGDITLTDFSVGHRVPDTNISQTLVAGGNLSLSRGGVWGDAFYGGSYSADTTVVYPRGAVAQGTPIDFAGRFAELRTLSSQLAGLPATGTVTRESWGGVMLRGTNPSLNSFHVPASHFTGASLLSIEAPAGSLVVINIHGASPTFSGFGHTFSGGIDQHGILYNFVDATAITAFGYGFWGTVLAPYAHVSFNDGSWDGGLYAVSLTGNAEGHINPLTDRSICP
jgi:choice-of-anchor A domain-containing protein